MVLMYSGTHHSRHRCSNTLQTIRWSSVRLFGFRPMGVLIEWNWSIRRLTRRDFARRNVWDFTYNHVLLLSLIHFLIFSLISRIRSFRASQSSSFLYEGQNFIVFSFCFLRFPCFGCFCCNRVTLRDGFSICCGRQCCCCCHRCSFCRCCRLCHSSCLICRSLFALVRFCFFDFLLEVSVRQLMFIFACVSFDFSRERLVVTKFPFCFGISNFAMTHLWSLPMSIVSLASASLLQQ